MMLKGLSDGSFFLSLDWLDHSLKSRLDDSLSLYSIYILCISLYIQWGSQQYLLAANSGGKVQILAEHVMNAHFNQQVRVL